MSMKTILTREVNIGVSTVAFVFRWPFHKKWSLVPTDPRSLSKKRLTREISFVIFGLRGHGNKSCNLIGSLSWVTENIPNSVAIRNEFVVANVSLNGLTRDLKQISINVSLSQRVIQKVKAARCLFKIKWWNFHSFYIWSLSINFFRCAKFLVLPQIRFHSLQVDLFNLAIFTVNCTKKNRWIQPRKSRIKFPSGLV